MHISSIWPIDRTLSGTTTPGQSGPGSNGNEGVLHIPQSFSITGTSPSDCLVSYPGHLLGGLTLLQRCSRCILPPTSRLSNTYKREPQVPPPYLSIYLSVYIYIYIYIYIVFFINFLVIISSSALITWKKKIRITFR